MATKEREIVAQIRNRWAQEAAEVQKIRNQLAQETAEAERIEHQRWLDERLSKVQYFQW
jgi:hypothetical protein